MKKTLAEEKGELDTLRTMLSMVRGSVGTDMFRRIYFTIGGKTVEVLRDGDLSCAVFVSNILLFLGLIKKPHTFVARTVADMERSGWKKIRTLKPGAVVLWAKRRGGSGERHIHIGFYLGGERAVSNFDAKRTPYIHHYTFGTRNKKPTRAITAIYWHPRLDR